MDDEELLESGRPPVPRRVWLAGAGIVALAIGSFIAVRALSDSSHSPHSPHRPLAAPSTSLPSVVLPPATIPGRSWPTAPGACGDDTELPIVSSVRPRQPTGIRVLLGGQGLMTVDFDDGYVETTFGTGEQGYVLQILPGSPTYAVTTTCGTRARLVRLNSELHPVGWIPLGHRAVLTDGAHTWLVTWPDNALAHGSLTPLGGGRAGRLPAGFSPDAITNGVIVGDLIPSDSMGRSRLALVDAANGHKRARLGVGQFLAAGNGQVFWTAGCDPVSTRSCLLHARPVTGGTTRSYPLPRPPGFALGVLSPNGRLLAFTLERRRQDRRYDQGHPIPPADIALLHLDTGALDVVPGIELPAKTTPGLVFSPDSKWLVIALDAGSRTRLLAWRPGLAHPYETRPVSGRAAMPVAMAIPRG